MSPRSALHWTAAICLAAALLPRPAAGAGGLYDSSRLQWSRLGYRAQKLGFKLVAEIESLRAPATGLAAELLVPPRGTGLVPAGREGHLFVLRNRGFGERSELSYWFDPLDAGFLQRTQDRRGRRPRLRTYRATEDGAYVVTRRPAEGEEGRPPECWSRVEDGHAELRSRLPAGTPVSGATGLFYVLSVADLQEEGDTHRLMVFSKNVLTDLVLEVKGRERLAVDYMLESPAGTQRVEGRRELLEIALTGRSVDGGGRQLELLGLHGDITLYVDPETRVLVQMSGKLKFFGTAHVKLRSVSLGPAPPAADPLPAAAAVVACSGEDVRPN